MLKLRNSPRRTLFEWHPIKLIKKRFSSHLIIIIFLNTILPTLKIFRKNLNNNKNIVNMHDRSWTVAAAKCTGQIGLNNLC